MRKQNILVVEDDIFIANRYADSLNDAGFAARVATSPDQAIEVIQKCRFRFDLVSLDMPMEPGERYTERTSAGGQKTGLLLARELKEKIPNVKLLACTGYDYPDVKTWFTRDNTVGYLRKPFTESQYVRTVQRLIAPDKYRPSVFIVHGRDRGLLLELKNFVQNRLRLGEPIILAERPSKGRTLLERFEYYSADTDIACVLMTPDDIGALAMDKGATSPRPRQNVVFELGYFLGAMRRASGRVIVLFKGPLEIPSDLAGVVYIDVTNGVESAAEQIRTEFQALLP